MRHQKQQNKTLKPEAVNAQTNRRLTTNLMTLSHPVFSRLQELRKHCAGLFADTDNQAVFVLESSVAERKRERERVATVRQQTQKTGGRERERDKDRQGDKSKNQPLDSPLSRP